MKLDGASLLPPSVLFRRTLLMASEEKHPSPAQVLED